MAGSKKATLHYFVSNLSSSRRICPIPLQVGAHILWSVASRPQDCKFSDRLFGSPRSVDPQSLVEALLYRVAQEWRLEFRARSKRRVCARWRHLSFLVSECSGAMPTEICRRGYVNCHVRHDALGANLFLAIMHAHPLSCVGMAYGSILSSFPMFPTYKATNELC